MKMSDLDENGQILASIHYKGKKYAYINSEMLSKMPWIKSHEIKSVHQFKVIKSQSDFTVLSLLKLVYPLSKIQLTFGNLYYQSGIRMKKSFLNYLKVCLELGFVKKSHMDKQFHFYKITDKGHQLLDMFYIA